jgi:RNA polymerase sigma-70 factor (ECF subfamily)
VRAATDTRAAVVADYDSQLMTQIACGRTEAFEELYDRYSARAYRMAWWICHEDGRAEEAVQETFVSIWRGQTRHEPARGTVAAWLLTTVRSRATDIMPLNTNHADRRTGEHTLNAHPTPGIAEQTLTGDETHRLREQLTQLPDAQREVIALAVYGQLSHTEIATALSLPAETVKGRMRLGMHELRTKIEPDVAQRNGNTSIASHELAGKQM